MLGDNAFPLDISSPFFVFMCLYETQKNLFVGFYILKFSPWLAVFSLSIFRLSWELEVIGPGILTETCSILADNLKIQDQLLQALRASFGVKLYTYAMHT